MEEVLNSDLAKEILTVLPFLEDAVITSIPDELIANLTELAADSTKDFYIERNRELIDQPLSRECRDFLSLLYYQFATEQDKLQLLNNWKTNDNNSDIDK